MLGLLSQRSLFTLSIALVIVESGQSGVAVWTKSMSASPAGQPQLQVERLRNSLIRREYQSVISKGQLLMRDRDINTDPKLRIRVRGIVGGALLAVGRDRDALQTLMPAQELAHQRSDLSSLISLDNSIAWIYLKMDNLLGAAEFADEALAAQRSLKRVDARVIFLRALIFAKLRDFAQSDPLFSEAINVAIDADDLISASTAWYLEGRGYAAASRNEDAQRALTESFRLRKIHHLPDLEVSMRDLADVLAARGDLKTSTVLLDEAVAAMGDPKSTADTWGFLLNRGRLRMMKGDLSGALQDLRGALALARRLDVIPTDDDRVTFESGLADLYSLFIDCGNRLHLQNHDPSLKAEIFEAAEENRAASLRALVPQPKGWRTSLPPEYETVLERLQTAERDLMTHPESLGELQVRQLRVHLDQLESRAQPGEDSHAISAFHAAKNALDADSAILSFHLGPNASWVWAITPKHFEVYRLPSQSELASQAKQLRDLIRSGASATGLGDLLGKILFDQLPAEAHQKHKWIVALDQDLFELPLSAVRWNGRYLIEDHAILITPGVRMLKPAGATSGFGGALIAMGDPIYNRADPRWHPSDRPFRWNPFGAPPVDPWHLARLTGTRGEATSAVASWGKGQAFTGPDATKKNFLRISQEQPTIVHLATHVIRAARDERAGMIVFGVNSQGEPEFLGMRDILQESLPIRLVVMSGCASGDAKAPPASGLMGLTRAWLGAGVDDVLATRWPSLDDNGPFFASFYTKLRRNPEKGAAEALQKTEIEMINSRSFRASPDYWGSYFLIGKL